jgi:H+/gluconate symporter-like permease
MKDPLRRPEEILAYRPLRQIIAAKSQSLWTARPRDSALLHHIAAVASGGMDTLPHNGAVITLLAVTGLTHRQAYKDIFVITITKTVAVFVAIAVFYLTGIY